MPKAGLERPAQGHVPISVLSWLEQQPGAGAHLLTNRAVRNHLGRYSADSWPEARAPPARRPPAPRNYAPGAPPRRGSPPPRAARARG